MLFVRLLMQFLSQGEKDNLFLFISSSQNTLFPLFFCSNRSAAFLNLSKVTKALADAEMTIKLKPTWEKVSLLFENFPLPLIALYSLNL